MQGDTAPNQGSGYVQYAPPYSRYAMVPRNPEGKKQVGERKEQSTDHRAVPRCSVGSTKVTDLEDAEGEGRKVMELTKGRIGEWIGEPDLLRRVALRSTFLATINIFLNI
uniref:Uncharacterized protein n=1 Tax=Solanum tuberosum TaxID=4113 RepID=M1DVP7_SOLTU